jgi:endonuclease VIII-like 1
MPEIAEVRLTSDYVNQVSPLTFNKIRKNPSHKGTLPSVPLSSFNLISESRGKEFMLYIICTETKERLNLLMTMGMSGFFNITKTGSEAKHSHLMFDSPQGWTLSFVDVRRFGKWKLAKGWSPNRGPDPIREFDKFKANILNNIDKPIFQKPIYEVLMNQTYFNGVGNYMRCEIVGRITTLNPFTPGITAINKHPEILLLCKHIAEASYISQLNRDNSFKIYFYRNHMKCYSIIDSNNRRFWYDKKWELPKG